MFMYSVLFPLPPTFRRVIIIDFIIVSACMWVWRPLSSMYSAVPPPEFQGEPSCAGASSEQKQEEKSKPANVQEHQWKKFRELQSRRERECAAGQEKRIAVTRNKALQNVCQQLSEADREVLEEEGVSLPRKWGKKRKRRRGESKREGGKGEDGERYREDVISERDKEWREVRQYMDPNPQLKGVDPGRHAPKSKLEEEMDDLIERGELEQAVERSERLAQREFATKVATAFDCRDYIKRKKFEDEKKRKRKPPKLQWRFEHKQPWEMKGNM